MVSAESTNGFKRSQSYDAFNRVNRLSFVRGGTTLSYQFNYDGKNRIGSVVLPTGKTVTNASGNDISANASHIANINPLRYRGYYYDAETGLYYLLARYYDPVTGRFVNADGQLTTGSDLTGLNLFAYCGNNPVNRYDPNGEAFLTATIFGIAVWKIAAACIGTLFVGAATYAVTDSLVKNPPVLPSISLPKIDIKPKSDSKEKDVAPAIPKDPPKKETVIYRYGGTNPGNFVPSPRDVATNSGLSFLTSPPPPGTKASVTTIEALNATGIVRAYQDKPGHVRVDPVIGTLADWRSGGSEHPCTIAVRSVVVKWDGGN